MIQKVVIDKNTKIVKRWGYCDFENDGSFDPDTEEIIEKNFDFKPSPFEVVVWTWNGETFVKS